MTRNILLILRIFRGAMKKMRQADRKLAKASSVDWWSHLRKRSEETALELWLKRDEGWLAFFRCDDALFLGILVWLKSDHLYRIYRTDGLTVGEKAAIEALWKKDPGQTLSKLNHVYNAH